MIIPIKIDVLNISDDKLLNKDFTISNNDKTSTIKEKIFTYYKDPTTFWIPEFVTLFINNKETKIKEDDESDITLEEEGTESGSESETFSNSNILTKSSLNILSLKTIYADNLLNNIRKNDFVSIYSDEEKYKNLYSYYKKIYTDLNEVLFENAFKIILYQFDKNQYKSFFEDVKNFALQIVERQKKAIAKWTKIDNVIDPIINLESKIKFDGKQESKVLNFEISFLNQLNTSINLLNVFNNVSLSKKYITLIINGSFLRKKEPVLKIFDNLPTNLTKNDIKDWILNEKKKDNAISFKKIKGVIFKILFNDILFSLSLNANGNVVISFDSNYKINMYTEIDYDTLINYSNEIYIDFVNYINEFDNIYNSNIILSNTDFSSNIISLSADFNTSERIQKNAFSEFCMQKTINENLFVLKDLKSIENISLYYTKNIQDDTKGITVNIKDNPYTMDSSTITILDSKNLLHSLVILKYITLINYHNIKVKKSELDEPQKLKQKSTIKDLKKQGVETISTNCQKPRQPIVDTEKNPLDGSYKLVWKNQTYVCPKEEYKYPGFTNKNIVCCFSKDQRRTAKYIKNLKIDELEIIVQASNYPITIEAFDESNQKFDKNTFLIKLISGPEEISSQSKFPYFYLDFIQEDRLGIQPIIDENLIQNIQQLEQEDSSIWLEPVSLSQIINTAPKNKCNQTPNLTSGKLKDLCSHHEAHKYFGYNQNSYPCCFDKPREIFITSLKKKKKDSKIIDQHILQNDKILDINRIGVLPNYLNTVLNKDSTTYYRLGVIQNKDSFLNCILTSIDKKFKLDRFANTLELKNFIVNKFKSLKLFYKVYNGNLPQIWENEDLFFKDLSSDNVYVDYKILLDLVFVILNLNVIIIDINEEVSENSKIICNNNFDKNFKSIVLLKRNINTSFNTPQFEIIIEFTKSISKTFNSDTNLVELLNNFVNKSCKEVYDNPPNYSYTPFIKISNFDSSDILTQITNSFNKVNWIILKKIPSLLLPIEETFVLDNINIQKFENFKKFYSFNDNLEFIKKLNQLYNLNVDLLGVVKTNEDTDAILLNYGLFLPIQKYENSKDLILNINYYPTLEKQVDFKAINNSSENFERINTNIYDVKKNVAFNLNKKDNEELKNKIVEIIQSIKYSNITKFKIVLSELNNLYNNKDKIFQFYLKIVVNEIVNDTIKMSILNNNVPQFKSNVSSMNLLKNENEILILNYNDFLNYIK